MTYQDLRRDTLLRKPAPSGFPEGAYRLAFYQGSTTSTNNRSVTPRSQLILAVMKCTPDHGQLAQRL